MEHPGFFDRAGPFTLAEIVQATGSELRSGVDATEKLSDVRPLTEAGPDHVTFVDNRKFLAHLAATKAGACFVHPNFASRVPAGTIALVSKAPYRAFALALQLFYPEAMWPKAAGTGTRAHRPDRNARSGRRHRTRRNHRSPSTSSVLAAASLPAR